MKNEEDRRRRLSVPERRKKTLLILDDRQRDREIWKNFLEEDGWTVKAYESLSQLKKCLDPHESAASWMRIDIDEIDVAVFDYDLGSQRPNGIEAADWLRQQTERAIPSLLLSGHANGSAVRNALLDGSLHEYAAKSSPDEVKERCEVLLSRSRTWRRYLLSAPSIGGENLSVEEPEMKDVIARVRDSVGPSMMPTLIFGPSGTGKETLAKEVHDRSLLGNDRWRAINCAAITEELTMADLFGFVRGSFSGANEHRLGVILEAAGLRGRATGKKTLLDYLKDSCPKDISIELAEDKGKYLFLDSESKQEKFLGTLFFDEVAELSSTAQAALLRFLDGSGFRPVGYFGPPFSPKVRILAATNRRQQLLSGVSDPQNNSQPFRADLYWRLCGWTIELGAISERIETAVSAARRMLQEFSEAYLRGDARGHFYLSAESEDLIREKLEEAGKMPNHELLTGNFRALQWWINRACWVLKNEYLGEKELRFDILNNAYSPLLASPVHEKPSPKQDPTPTEDFSIRDVLEDFTRDQASGLDDPDIQRDFEYLEVADSVMLDSLRQFLGSRAANLRQDYLGFLTSPEKFFDLPQPIPVRLRVRWRYIFLLAVMDLAVVLGRGNPTQKVLEEKIGRKGKTAFLKELRDILDHFGISVQPSVRLKNPKNLRILKDLALYLYDRSPRTATFTCRDAVATDFRELASRLSRKLGWNLLPNWPGKR